MDAHKGMNIDNDEFVAVLDDALLALEKNNVGQREKEEVLYILYSMKSEIVYLWYQQGIWINVQCAKIMCLRDLWGLPVMKAFRAHGFVRAENVIFH